MALIIRGLDLDASDNASTSDVSTLGGRVDTIESWQTNVDRDISAIKQLVQLYAGDNETTLSIADALNVLANTGSINVTFTDAEDKSASNS